MADVKWLERKVNWIAVSDKLPPLGRSVLATDGGGHVHEAFISSKKKWRWAHGDTATTITYWMEFPNPPAKFDLNRVAAAAKS